MDARNKRVVIFGVGRFGGQIEAARFFARRGARVLATDLAPPERLSRAREALEGVPIEWRLGEHREEDFRGADLVVVSPAIPRSSPFFVLIEREGIPWTTEINLTLARLRAPVYAVTGSNGKSTTTALLGAVVEAGGFRAHVGGNIGRPLLNEADAIEPGDRAVLELSSFQLEDLRAAGGVRPALAIVTNITPNHLDRHGTFEAYARAKQAIVERQEPGDVAVLNREDPRVLAFARATRARVVTFGTDPPGGGGPWAEFPAGSFVAEGAIWFWEEGGRGGAGGRARRLASLDALGLPGRHNLLNALAVAAAAGALGYSAEAFERALRGFRGIPDRLETVRVRRGVRWVNDSKATTPEAARAALEAFPPPLVAILGGKDKGMDARPLAESAVARAGAVFLIGSVRERLRAEIASRGGTAEVAVCDSLEEAVSRADAAAPPGATVLFSPGFASYDMFASYEERGERFRALVAALPE